jgi:hypothetical protein
MLDAPDMKSVNNKLEVLICQPRMYSAHKTFLTSVAAMKEPFIFPADIQPREPTIKVKGPSHRLARIQSEMRAWFYLWITIKQDLWCGKRRKEDWNVLCSSPPKIWSEETQTMDSALLPISPPPQPHCLAESCLHSVQLLRQRPSKPLWASNIIVSKLQVGSGYQGHHSHLRKVSLY